MTSHIKKLSSDYLRKYVKGRLSPEVIISGLESQDYTVVRYNNVDNNEDVACLIKLLGVENYIWGSKGFVYADSNNRIVFLHDDM